MKSFVSLVFSVYSIRYNQDRRLFEVRASRERTASPQEEEKGGDFTIVCVCANLHVQMFLFMVLRTHLIVTRDDDEFLAPGSFEWMLFIEIFRQGHLLRCVRERVSAQRD